MKVFWRLGCSHPSFLLFPTLSLRSSVLDVTVKDYRKLIFENAISEFDFRKYVFARQSEVSVVSGCGCFADDVGV